MAAKLYVGRQLYFHGTKIFLQFRRVSRNPNYVYTIIHSILQSASHVQQLDLSTALADACASALHWMMHVP